MEDKFDGKRKCDCMMGLNTNDDNVFATVNLSDGRKYGGHSDLDISFNFCPHCGKDLRGM